MKLEKYIKQLLQENEMVIVPGFGAFISEYISAIVDETSGDIKPPSSKLIFDTKIKNNDGLLVGQVADATRCTHFEALQKIEKERDNIIYQLDKGEKVELDEIGILVYNEEKQVILVSKEDASFSLENFGLETTNIEELTEELVENTETIPAQIAEEIPEESAENDNITPEEEISEEPVVIIEEKEVIEKEEETTTKQIVAESTYASFEKKEKRKSGWIWLIAILIPLFFVSVFIYMKQNKQEEPIKALQQHVPDPVVMDTTTKEDMSMIDSVETQAKDSLSFERTAEEKTIEIEIDKYYLVGGSFKEEENAETYLQTLKEKGFEPFHMGKYGNFFIVGIGSFNSENEAIVAKDEYLEQNPGSGVWILKR